MDFSSVLAAEPTPVDLSGADRATVESVLAAVARLRGWLDGVEVACARRLAVLAEQGGVVEPDQVVGAATRTGPGHGRRVQARAVTAAIIPEFGRALARGRVSGSHVDALGNTVRSLTPAQRAVLVDRSAELVDLAAQTTPTTFRRHLERLADAIRADDGISRLARQQAQVRLRTWVEPDTGMVRLSGRFDPDTGSELVRRLRDQADTLFHATLPASCPDDPIDKQDFLRAHALLALTNGQGGGRPVVIMTIDHRTATHGWHAESRVDVGLDGVCLPLERLQERIARADVVPVVVDRDGVAQKVAVARPGCRTDLASLPARLATEPGLPLGAGRTRRLASRTQRFALQAMYRTCAMPGCPAPIDLCQPHHCHDWEAGGATDLDNLVPLCARHHRMVHTRGWGLRLDDRRRLTVTPANGPPVTTGPPAAQWAGAPQRLA